MSAASSTPENEGSILHPLRALRLGLETQHEPVVLMHADCPVAKAEGLTARAQVEIKAAGRSSIATLYQVRSDWLRSDQVGLSEVVWRRLGVVAGAELRVSHPHPLKSTSLIRSKVYGHRLDHDKLLNIVHDIAAERLSDVELSAFITAFSSQPAELNEMVSLTQAMIAVGDRLSWPGDIIVDKHSVGGLPGNRTTPIVVAIAAAAGLTMPKTSSRAITSPAGTADTMETMAPVDLDIPAMRKVVETEGGCLVWGGSVRLSPADDILIRVERALDLDSPALLVASVLSKKVAAGSTHVILDMPVGPTAKIRTTREAQELGAQLTAVAAQLGLIAKPSISDGSQPIGRGIGPALEGRDVLKVLRGDRDAPGDLRNRAKQLAGALLEIGGAARPGEGEALAARILDERRALSKFIAICEAQGGFREPPTAPLTWVIGAARGGLVSAVDNRVLARVAKLAGAPRAKTAGLELHVKLGDVVEKGQPLFTLHGESTGEIEYALAFANANPNLVMVAQR